MDHHKEIAAKLTEMLGTEVDATFVAAAEEVCGRPFAELTVEDLRRFRAHQQAAKAEAGRELAQVEAELGISRN